MNTLTLIAQKGGTGKATLAINHPVAAEASGWRAAWVDLDLQARAAGRERPAVAAVPAPRLDAALRAVRSHGADVAVIDTAAEIAALFGWVRKRLEG